jgi:hypothetical protein
MKLGPGLVRVTSMGKMYFCIGTLKSEGTTTKAQGTIALIRTLPLYTDTES